jgi:Spy/CpxP family protein refolding chaperone
VFLFKKRESSQDMKVNFWIKSLPLAIVALFIGFVAQAQNTTANTKSRKAQPTATVGKEAEAEDKMAKDLELTPEQQVAFKKANDDYKAKSKANKAAKKEDMERLRQERDQARRSILNAKQQEKYDQMQAKKAEKRKAKAGKKAQRKADKKENKAERKAIKEELKKQ